MLFNVHSETQTQQRQNANVPSFAKRVLPSFPRDRWRNCRLNFSNSIGSECSLEFVIFLQPMVRVTISHDLVTTFIVVHDRFTTNGYALPVPHVFGHKMDLQWKPQSNLYEKKFTLVLHEVVIKISTALQSVCICRQKLVTAISRKNLLKILFFVTIFWFSIAYGNLELGTLLWGRFSLFETFIGELLCKV